MGSPWPESDRRRMIDELVRGQDLATKIRVLLNESKANDGSVTIEDLVMKVQNSFINTISILNNGEFDEVSQIPTNSHLCSPYWDSRKSEDSGESIKSSKLKDRRGCYKRRKSSLTWTKETSTLIDDGHAWRKYGQKVILNAKYPRNYFRCTHKHDQGCQATKQVQRIQEEPPRHRTTYYGHHTCKNLLKSSQILLDSTARDSSILLSFDTTNKQDNPLFQSSFIKQEYKDDLPSDMTNNQSSSSDYLLSPELTTFESSGHVPMLSCDHGDVISGVTSCSTSTHSLDMSMMVESVDDFDVLQFDF